MLIMASVISEDEGGRVMFDVVTRFLSCTATRAPFPHHIARDNPFLLERSRRYVEDS